MKVTSENTTYSCITKDYTIELDNGDEIEVTKWWKDSEYGDYECDYEIAESTIYQKLTEEQQEDLVEFINELK